MRERVARFGDRIFDRLRDERAFTLTDRNAINGELDSLRNRKYAVLVTFRGNGEAVPSPVWFAIDEAGIAYLHTARDVGKVRRLTADSRVVIAPANMRGKPLGPGIRGRGRLLPEEAWPHAEETLAAAYGIGRRMSMRLLGAPAAAGVYIEITPGR